MAYDNLLKLAEDFQSKCYSMLEAVVAENDYEDMIKLAAGKYDHINFKPSESIANAAARGLELRKQNKGRGGLSVQQAHKAGIGSGVARAVSLKNRKTLSPSTVRRMKAFFDRHEGSKKIDPGKTHATDKGYIAWELWGGDPGRSWAEKICRQMDAADKKKIMKNIKSICKLATLYYATANIHLKKLIDAPENISPEACASCGGKCCKSMPGIAHPGQFGNNKQQIKDNVEGGILSGQFNIDYWEGDTPPYDELSRVYYIRAATKPLASSPRMPNKVIDPSWGGECNLLGPEGCKLDHEHRPVECQNLKAKTDSCEHVNVSYTKRELVREWRNYQDIINELINKHKFI